MAYTTYQSAIGALWAFTRPDGSTFYYQRNGWPTGVADRNGNCIDIELSSRTASQDRVRVTEVVDAAGVANAAIRDRRAFKLTYYEARHGSDNDERRRRRFALGDDDDDGGDAPKVKSIRDHTGSLLRFEYYKDDRLKRVLQDGGTTPEGLSAPTRSWVFTYTDWGDDDDEDHSRTSPRTASARPLQPRRGDPRQREPALFRPRPARRETTASTITAAAARRQGVAAEAAHRPRRSGHELRLRHAERARRRSGARSIATAATCSTSEGSPISLTDAVTATTEETTAVSWTADRQRLQGHRADRAVHRVRL